MSCDHAYYLPGRDEPLVSGPGEVLAALGCPPFGRALPGDLTGLGFDDQVDLVRSDLTAGFWRPGALAIGRSYGAYLLMHALAESDPFPGHVVLFSPMLGAALVARDGRFYGAIPPRAEKLADLARAAALPAPASLDIYLGDSDPGCAIDLASKISISVGGRLHVVPGARHDLPSGVIEEALRPAL